MTNRLSSEPSTYLRQHADQPVDWWPWGEDALAEASRRGVPLLISIGYAACHWCHVMAHESFDDPAVAAYLNEHFVAIKIDREERPDLDSIYLQATQALSGQAGWPMTVFATPAGEPFAAGTYFPPERRGPTPSFLEVCHSVATSWAQHGDRLAERGSGIATALTDLTRARADAAASITDAPDPTDLIARIGTEFDPHFAGFGAAPKFPMTPLLTGLLAHPDGREMAFATLRAIDRGGLHDVVTGGFARYCVDRQWRVPHFEQMLADNAQLLAAFAQAWRLSGDATFADAARGIVAWMRSMQTPSGLLATSLDADAGGREGAHAVFTRAEFDELLGADAAWAADFFGVTDSGNFDEGASVLRWAGDRTPLLEEAGSADRTRLDQVLEEPGAAGRARVDDVLDTADATDGAPLDRALDGADATDRARVDDVLDTADATDRARLDRVLGRLRAARAARPQPTRDDTCVAELNGLAIDALVSAALILDEPSWLGFATDLAEASWRIHWDADEADASAPSQSSSPRLWRTSRDGMRGAAPATASDYAALALGFARLGAALADRRWLDRARTLLDTLDAGFAAPQGGWFDAAADVPGLFTRPRELDDDPLPSGTSLAIAAHRRVGQLLGDPDAAEPYFERARRADRERLAVLAQAPRWAGWALRDLVERDAPEIVVTAPTRAEAWPLAVAAARSAPSLAAIVIAGVDEMTSPAADFGALVADRLDVTTATAFVCRGTACELPTSDPEKLRALLAP